MLSTPDHRVVKRVLMQNILLQKMLCISFLSLISGKGRLRAKIDCHYRFMVDR
jgi:hypothetical protein